MTAIAIRRTPRGTRKTIFRDVDVAPEYMDFLLSNPEIGVATVAAEAGHAQPSTTLAIYTQVYDKRCKEIRNQMSKELYE